MPHHYFLSMNVEQMTQQEVLQLLQDMHEREIDKLRPHLANMDSRGEIGMKGNYHNGVAAGLRLAINLVKTIS